MQTKFSDAAAAKQDLIQQAKELANSEEWQKTSTKFKELMDAWKAAGSAGREKKMIYGMSLMNTVKHSIKLVMRIMKSFMSFKIKTQKLK